MPRGPADTTGSDELYESLAAILRQQAQVGEEEDERDDAPPRRLPDLDREPRGKGDGHGSSHTASRDAFPAEADLVPGRRVCGATAGRSGGRWRGRWWETATEEGE